MIPEHRGEKMDVEHAMQMRLYKSQAQDLARQLHEAWDALAFWSGIPYNDAILEYLEQKKMLEIDERLERE